MTAKPTSAGESNLDTIAIKAKLIAISEVLFQHCHEKGAADFVHRWAPTASPIIDGRVKLEWDLDLGHLTVGMAAGSLG